MFILHKVMRVLNELLKSCSVEKKRSLLQQRDVHESLCVLTYFILESIIWLSCLQTQNWDKSSQSWRFWIASLSLRMYIKIHGSTRQTGTCSNLVWWDKPDWPVSQCERERVWHCKLYSCNFCDLLITIPSGLSIFFKQS